ncbi:MAG: phosphatidate cytidylyltransferase, partial [Rubricoccaceae bacterium]|nr:phosphatidate cytidylyltransferase [Rubricoccaceae bacterium]
MNTDQLPYTAELQRKAIHIAALVIPVSLLVLGRSTALMIFVPLAVAALAIDFAGQRFQGVRSIIERLFSFVMRPEELPPIGSRLVFNGATWMCVSAAVCAFFFTEPIAASGLVMVMIGDGAAAVFGRRFGTHRYPRSDKSWEGSLAFFVFGVLGSLPLLFSLWGHPPLSLPQIGLGA